MVGDHQRGNAPAEQQAIGKARGEGLVDVDTSKSPDLTIVRARRTARGQTLTGAIEPLDGNETELPVDTRSMSAGAWSGSSSGAKTVAL
jgi:hypothetical protein